MCAKLLTCPLCSQPAFLTLDALRTELISVATRPLVCPVCNEVLLGVDKLTIHLFSHALNLSNSGKTNSDSTKLADVNSHTDGYSNFGNEYVVPSQTWNVLNKETTRDEQLLQQENGIKQGAQVRPKVAITPFCKIPSNQSSVCCSVKNNNISVTSSTCSKDQNQLTDSAPLIATTNQVVFLQSSQQLRQVSSQDLNGYVSDEIYLQTIPKEKQSSGFSKIKTEHLQNGETVKQLQPDYTANMFKQSEASGVKNCGKSILQFQPIWSKNTGQEIRVQNILVGSDNTETGQLLTISPKAVDENNKVPQQSSADVQNQINLEEKIINISETHRPTPDQSQVLPQLKAFKALATKEKTERCDICGFYFSDPNILTLHKQLIHMINENDLNRKPEDLLKNYPCHLCSKVFKMKGSLMVHMRVAHIGYNLGLMPKEGDPSPIPGEQGYNCPTCGKNFKKEQHVTQHLKTHEGKQWECDVCSKMFTTKYFLKKHKRLHSGEMPYKCNICDKTFTFQQSYHKHRLYHKDDKPHVCTTCGRSFKELSTLHNHERIHTGEKPFACETCGKCFRQRVSYLVHRRIHTGAMPYKCTACGKSFRYKVSQRTHKCTAQPPGTVVRQSSDLVQRLLQVSQIKDAGTKENNEIQKDEAHISYIPKEDNRYILIIDVQGQHILTRQSEFENKCAVADMEVENGLNLNKYDNPNDETFIKDLWGHNIPNGTTLKDSMEMSAKDSSIELGQKSQTTDENNDFFSMVLSPVENNEIRSPSSEMEHLRLSSPTNNEHILDYVNNPTSSVESTSNVQCNIRKCSVDIKQNFRTDNTRSITPLPTINEESLKQLLYGAQTGLE